ncbi:MULTISPECIES: hypothetical protein [Sphingobacterium]|uniref:hypothetical protein n=1 Tax=Sphingobacterium TaxID=28453 RepID=UPI002579D100|nr:MULTISPECIES: hypothetical protein [Sphingobacterium]
MKTKIEYIKAIHIVPSNLEHIAKTGEINGSLLISLEKAFDDFFYEKEKAVLKKSINTLDESLNLLSKIIDRSVIDEDSLKTYRELTGETARLKEYIQFPFDPAKEKDLASNMVRKRMIPYIPHEDRTNFSR